MSKLSHTNEEGKANMVDVGHKLNQLRTSKAEGFISLGKKTIRLIPNDLEAVPINASTPLTD